MQVPSEIVGKWQEIVNLLAEIMHVPSALVMKVEPPNIAVFVSSESKGNPYERDDVSSLNTGLYCETVMKTVNRSLSLTLYWRKSGNRTLTSSWA